MTLIPATTPQTPNVPFNAGGNAQNNAISGQRQQRANAPWTLRVGQANVESIYVGNVWYYIGFDTLAYNSYKSLTTPTYTLGFAPVTVSAVVFPLSIITVPEYGYYEIIACVTGQNYTIVGNSVNVIAIWKNSTSSIGGTGTTLALGNQISLTPNGFNGMTVQTIELLNPGDTINAQVYISGMSGGWGTSGATFSTYMIIRYLGLS